MLDWILLQSCSSPLPCSESLFIWAEDEAVTVEEPWSSPCGHIRFSSGTTISLARNKRHAVVGILLLQ